MNFGGFYFKGPVEALRNEGYRVVVPDQIGVGRSSKPVIPYNFHDMALNSRALLFSLNIAKVSIVGHSMGGMLTARFAASYPDRVDRIILCNPIGLTDVRWTQSWQSHPPPETEARWLRKVLTSAKSGFPSPTCSSGTRC